MEKLLVKSVYKAYENNKRLVAPLIGFPGINLTQSTIKLAQQNIAEHLKVIKANVKEFNPDAVFTLMDLSVEANALGRYTIFPENESATVLKKNYKYHDIKNLEKIEIQFDTRLLGYVEVVKKMKKELPASILRGAYVTGPYTLAALFMGADEAAMATVLNPGELLAICEVMNRKIEKYVEALVDAGAQMICILEPSAVMLGPEQLEKFSGNFVKGIVNNYTNTEVAIIYHICGNTMPLLEKMCETGVDALSLDSSQAGVELVEVAKQVPKDIIIIGNINPVGKILNGRAEEVKDEVRKLLESMDEYPNFILSTGCDLPQETPVENIQAFMQTGRQYNCKLKQNV